MNAQIRGNYRFGRREIKMVNPRNWNSEEPGSQIKSIAFVNSSQVKRDYGIGPTKTGISLDVEVDNFRLDVDSSDESLFACALKSKKRKKIVEKKKLKCMSVKSKMQLVPITYTKNHFKILQVVSKN